MGYDSPNFTTRFEHFVGAVGGDATTEYGKFRRFQAAQLKKVHAVVTTAGTATTHKLDVYHGTASIGTIALSTSAAGSIASSALLDRRLESLDQISVKTGADADGIADVIYEYETEPDSIRS